MDPAVTAADLIRSALVWDDHSGFMPDLAADLHNLALWRDAGVDYLSINVGFDLMPWQKSLAVVTGFRDWILEHPEGYLLARSGEDVRRAKREGRLAVSFDLEGMNALDGRPEMVEAYYALGVRQMLFAYNRDNAAGGGCHDADAGLTSFGREVIDEMKRLGMLIDVSHCGLRTSLEVIDYARGPVIFSHSNARSLAPHGRNISDEQIRACAASGGVIGANGVSLFLGGANPGVERLADHIEHLIEVAGPRHVGLGLDFGFEVEIVDLDQMVAANPEFWPADEGYGAAPIDFVAPRELPRLVESLLRRGHQEAVIRGVLGGNFLAVAEQVWG